jgi:hypothetical protein
MKLISKISAAALSCYTFLGAVVADVVIPPANSHGRFEPTPSHFQLDSSTLVLIGAVVCCVCIVVAAAVTIIFIVKSRDKK